MVDGTSSSPLESIYDKIIQVLVGISTMDMIDDVA